ncbi:MAG: flagellar basal-body rod protein FlgG [Clostridia bacterium]|nr:flagellar basal-body rod protein FlgG [Clostridia bacterium]
MMRALWTAATGMTGQQTNVDVIANNLSNVNTTAYKKSRVEFKDLVYEERNRAYNLKRDDAPANLQIGLGARPSATLKDFSDGTYTMTENRTDLAISGPGFFTLRDTEGNTIYTRDGSFKFSAEEDGGQMLVNSQGYPVLDAEGNEIKININNLEEFAVDIDGSIYVMGEDGLPVDTGIEIGLVKFQNPAGLLSIGSNNYQVTANSGQPVWENALDDGEERSTIMQNYLEGSNVELVEEMVNLIVAQRAYEINSKTVQAADDMLQQANNLKR